MSAAFLPSPSSGLWRIGPIPVRGYALCVVSGIIVAIWLASRRYRAIGGRPGIILDVATPAVTFGLVGARLYSVITGYRLYFGHGRAVTDVLRIWDGGLGLPGAIAAGAFGAWIACRRKGVSLGPVAGAAAPAMAFGQAIGCWGNWFSQNLYGAPATVPWAMRISPEHRIPGYENFATFQPVFLYESAWDVMMGMLLIWAAGQFLLTGDRVFAAYAGLYAAGRIWVDALRVGYSSPHFFWLPVSPAALACVVAIAAGYLYSTRSRKGPDKLTQAGELADRAVLAAGGTAAGAGGGVGGAATAAGC